MNLCKDCVSKNVCGNPNVTGCISYTKQDEKFMPINCYVCNASGRIAGNGHRHSSKCARCNGTGVINYYTMTNEDFLRTATTEQLAEEIVKMTLLDVYKLYDRMESAEYDIGIGVGAKKVIVEWLKQPHTNS